MYICKLYIYEDRACMKTEKFPRDTYEYDSFVDFIYFLLLFLGFVVLRY